MSRFFPLGGQFALNHEHLIIDHLRNRSRTGLLRIVFVNSEGQHRVYFAQQVNWVENFDQFRGAMEEAARNKETNPVSHGEPPAHLVYSS